MYALVKNNNVVVTGDIDVLSAYLLATDGVNISLPQTPSVPQTIGGYTLCQVSHVGGTLPVRHEYTGTVTYVYDGTAVAGTYDTQPTVVDMSVERNNAKQRVDHQRSIDSTALVMAHNKYWQADPQSQALLSSAISLAQAGLPLPTVWRDASNTDMPVSSIADLLAIAGAMAQQVQTAYATSWTRKAAIDAAATPEDIDLIVKDLVA